MSDYTDDTDRIASDILITWNPMVRGIKPITGKLSAAQIRVLRKYDGISLPYVSSAILYGFQRDPPKVEHKTLIGLILGKRMRVFRVRGSQPGFHPPSAIGAHAEAHYRLSIAPGALEAQESATRSQRQFAAP